MKRIVATAALALTLGACGVSTQQEVQMGQQYAAQVDQQLPIINDPEINRYVNVLGDSVAKLADTRNLEWTFRVVDSPEVNAFAIPGGFIYVNRGLIERAQNMSQLAGALGHEIGHVTRRHSIQQMQKQQGAQLGLGVACVLTRVCNSQAGSAAVNLGATALFAKFSRNDEAEADAEGVKNTVRAGISPEGIPELFQILIDERKSNPSAVEAWFATHPLEEDRIQATRAQIATYDPAILRQLSHDSPNFHTFQARIRSLPPSPAAPSGQ